VVNDLGGRAKAGKLKPDDTQGELILLLMWVLLEVFLALNSESTTSRYLALGD
jgi:hypothetical protein